MQKLLSLGSKDFLTGISPSAHLTNAGIFLSAAGINPFIDPFPESFNVGLLQTSPVPTDLTSTVVVDTPIAATTRVTAANTGSIYILGASGHFYSMSLSTLASPSDLRSGTPITDPATGIFIFKPNGGTEKLYYMQKTQIGSWDLSGTHPTGWTDNAFTGLQSTTLHPVIQVNDRVYYGNKDRIGMVYDSSGTAANNDNVLNFPSDYVVTCLAHDGEYLIIGVTKNLGDNRLAAETKILFWDTSSPSWNKEWIIKDTSINSIKPLGNGFLAIGGRHLWNFNFATKPIRVRPLSTANSLAYGYPNGADILNDAVIWGGGSSYLGCYGKLVPEAPNAYHEPYSGLSTPATLVVGNPLINSIVVGTNGPKLYKYSLSAGGAVATANTLYFTPESEYKIAQVDVWLGAPLASGDQLTIKFQADESATAVTFGTVAYSTHGAVRKVQLKAGSFYADQFKMILSFDAGNVKIKRIDVYGTTNSTPVVTRVSGTTSS